MKKTFIRLLFCSLALAYTNGFAQHDSISYAFKLSAHKGFIIAHHDSLSVPANGANPGAVELDFSWLNYSRNGWATANCYRKTGISIGYADYDKPSVLGTGSYLLLYTEPQLSFNKKVDFSFTSAVGLIFLSTVYNRDTNSTNRFYSNKLSGLMRLGFNASYQINDHIELAASVNFNHISNGGIIFPNSGMNYPTGSISLSYQLHNTLLEKREKIKTYDPTWRYTAQLFTVRRLIMHWDNESGRERMMGLSLTLSKQFTHLSSWLVGVEISHDASMPKTGDLYGRKDDPMIASLLGGHQLNLARFHFSQLIGLYAYKKYDNDNYIFQRYILSYDLAEYNDKYFSLGFSLKAHAEVAEMLDVRVGITF